MRPGEQLRKARLARGLNQRQLATLLGVAPADLSFRETGKREITPLWRDRLRKAGIEIGVQK